MSLKKYWILTSLATFLLLPLLLSICALALSLAVETVIGMVSAWWLLLTVPLGALPLLALAWGIYWRGQKAALPDTFLSRYGPFMAPIFCTLAVWLMIATVTGGDFTKSSFAGYGFLVFLPFFFIFLLVLLSGMYWLLPVSAIAAQLFFMACFAAGTWRSRRLATRENRKGIYAAALILALAGVATIQGCMQHDRVLHEDPKYPELPNESDIRWDYAPFKQGTRLVSPRTPPSLQIGGDYPKLDGAVALIPIYAAAANAIYQEDGTGKDMAGQTAREKAVGRSETTPAAYMALLDGRADIIFTAAPSEEQVRQAAEKGITYTLTPIAREAFVFLVNEQNPVKSLNVGQIRDIYSGKINDWKDVGGAPGAIMAFQRNEGSGSQTAMLRLMGKTPMRKPLKAEHVGGMGGLVRRVASYRNMDHAIGYSFRYYATTMYKVAGIRLLAIGGVAPTVENIHNGTYPFTADIYMVTARPLSANAQKLHDWFLSEEGQQLIEDAGYVPLRGGSR